MLYFEQIQPSGHAIFDFKLDIEVVDGDGRVYLTNVNFQSSSRASTKIQLEGSTKISMIRVDPSQHVLFSLDFNHHQNHPNHHLHPSSSLALLQPSL